MSLRNCLVILVVVGSAIAFAGEFIPKSYYVIDHNGHKSDVVYFRSKRDVELFPLLRFRRGGGSASASASSSSSSGGGGGPLYFGDYNPGIIDPGFAPNFNNFGSQGGFGDGGHGGLGGANPAFAGASSSSSSGLPGHGVGSTGYNGPILFSRFGEDTGTGVHVSGSAQGEKGAFSSSSSSVDGDGKIKYSVQSGKY